MYKYLVLQTDDYNAGPPIVGRRKQFKAISMAITDDKAQEIQRTAGGLDVATGRVYKVFQYHVRVPEEAPTPEWGTREDIIWFYGLCNPNVSPKNVLTLVDHYGDSHNVVFHGKLTPEPITSIIIGSEASYIILIELHGIPGDQQ
jgi:hypothetical protein